MKKTKFFAVVMAAVMTLSMVACGEQTSNDVTPTTAPTTAPTEAPAADPTATPVPAPQNVTIADASITFEDGNYAFVEAWMDHARSANCEISLVDYNGSKAVKVTNTTGTSKVPFLAIDVSSLFGADVAKIAGVEMVIGTSYEDGSFHSTSGDIMSLWGAEADDNSLGTWSVYMEKKNPKVITGKVPAGNELVADAYNMIIVGLTTDNGASDEGIVASFYVDDIRFYDAAGNTMKPADTSVAFNKPASNGPDLSNLYAVSNAVEFPGFTTSGTAWGQNGFDIPQEVLDAMVPGSVVEISFTSGDGSMWVVMPDSAAGWMRVGQGSAYINNSKTVAQIPYEAFEELLGADKTTWGARMQCEAAADWEVYSVKVGTANKRMAVANAVEFPDFVKSAGGWAQDGLEMPQEIIDALVPGSVVEIDYASEDGALWIVMPDSAAGWMRCGQGTAVCDGSKCYVTYEQIAEMCGDDKTTWGARMQCEGSAAWEVYGVRVGTKVEYPVLGGFVDFPDFVKSAGGWAQDGLEMPQEIIDALVPGAVVEISFVSEDNSMWIVMPDSAAGWMRVAQGAATIADGKAYITYEQIAAACGEDKSTWGARMQCEAATAWEVYGIRVGKGPVSAGGEAEKPQVEDPTIQTADGTVAYTASKTFADSAWWTQLSMPKDEIIGTTATEEISAIKFTSDTNFVIGYKDVNGNWIQNDSTNTYVIKSVELGDAWDLCLALSKGDGVEYTINWEVYTGGDKTVVYAEAEEPAAPALPETVITAEGGKGTVAAADASWWTQIALTKDQLLAGVALENVTGFKFTGDTDFIIAYNDGTSTWIQKEAASSFELTKDDINFADDVYYFCFVLSKGDSVVYNLAWEVLSDGAAATETPAVEEPETPAVEEPEAPAAEAVTGDFSGQYVGDYSAEWIPASAFAACTDGATVTINYTLQTEGRANQWWNLTFIKGDWSKYLDAKYYIGEVPAFSEYEFVAMEGTSYTFTLSADALAQINADGQFGIQTDGVIFNSYSVTPAK